MKYTYEPRNNDENQDDEPRRRYANQETALGISQNIVAALAYLLGWVTGIAFLIIEKENSFVRFHAMQAIAVFVPLTIASAILGFIPFIGAVLSTLLGILGVFLWLFLMFQAVIGMRFKVPYAGDFAERQLRDIDAN